MTKEIKTPEEKFDVISQMSIYQKLAKVRGIADALQKNKSGYGYKYVSEDEILVKVKAGMDKYRLSLLPSFRPGTLEIVPYKSVDKKGKDSYEILAKAEMVFRWVNNDNPAEAIDVDWVMAGQQTDVSQAIGSGLTYMNRYFLLKYFQIATTEDDPDNWRKKKNDAGDDEDKEAMKEKIDELIKTVNDKLGNGASRDDICAIIAKHNPGNKKNPNAIKDIESAQAALDEIKKIKVNTEGKKDAE